MDEPPNDSNRRGRALRPVRLLRRPPRPAPAPSPLPKRRADDSPWEDILPSLPPLAEVCGERGPERTLGEWSLALTARRVPNRLEEPPPLPQARELSRSFRLLTPTRLVGRAQEEILAYEAENRLARLPEPVIPTFRNAGTTLLVLLCLALFYAITRSGQFPDVDWDALGRTDCFEVLVGGQLQRCVTALTLHADVAHLAANIGFGAVFFLIVCRELGSGLGWLAILLAGGLGNWLNCQAHGAHHLSLGASTAVFGAVGVQSGVRALRRSRFDLDAVLLPVAGGAMFLAFLGAEGERTDLGAHLFGFVAGLGLGGAIGLWLRRFAPPDGWTGRALAAAALAILCLAWAKAILG